MKREYAGSVGVDSGQLMILDPCYVRYFPGRDEDDEFSTTDRDLKEFAGGPPSYDTICRRTLAEPPYGECAHNGFVNLAFAFGGFGGDGVFPVYVTTDDAGMVLKVEVDFS